MRLVIAIPDVKKPRRPFREVSRRKSQVCLTNCATGVPAGVRRLSEPKRSRPSARACRSFAMIGNVPLILQIVLEEHYGIR